MTEILDLSRRPIGLIGWPVANETAETRPLFGIYSEAGALLERFHAEHKAIDEPGSEMHQKLSPVGRRDAQRELAERALEQLAKLRLRPAFAQAPDRIRAEYLTARNASALTKTTDAVSALRAREVRDWYRGLDASAALNVRRHAVAAGDTALLSALLDTPSPAMRLIPDAEAATIEAVILERSNPARFADLRSYELAYRAAAETLDRVESFVATTGGVRPPSTSPGYVPIIPILAGLPPAA
ncbi:MAG: hypothetical protein KJ058_06095 [Thermoanaerobaculia bacterium]|nr:hypothetical protein [Thermoanaerobaculia bacterium]